MTDIVAKKGILVIAHGSRAKETEATLDGVLAMVREMLPGAIVEAAFMEFSDRTVERGVAALAAKSVTEIKIVPYFLFMGIHMKEDIPNLVAACAEKYPSVRIAMGEPIGADRRLAQIVADRIEDWA